MSDFNDFLSKGNYRFNWGEPGGAFLNIFGSLGNLFGLDNEYGQAIDNFGNTIYNAAGNSSVVNPNYDPSAPTGLLGSLGLFGGGPQQPQQQPYQPPELAQTGAQAQQTQNNPRGLSLMQRDYVNPFEYRNMWKNYR